MANKNRKNVERKVPPKPSVPEKPVPLQPAGEIVVSQEDTAAKVPPDKTIHRRRPLPAVPDKDVEQTPTDGD
jgi:hypothetical protein